MKQNNAMKNFFILALIFSLTLSLAGSVFAAPTTLELRQNVQNAKQELQEVKQDTKMMMKEMKASDSAEKKNHAKVMNAELTAINGTTLTITKDGKTLTVTTDTKTIFRRHYGGLASLTELSVGNMLDVLGTYTDDTKLTIAAKNIRDRSLMKFRGAFIGDVVSKTGNSFVLKSKHRGDQTVTVDAKTKYVDRKQQVITLNDVVVGHRVRVKGVWDKSNNTVTQITQVKDFSLPPKATESATPSSSPSAEVTP
jgi:hypothetical protein